MSLPLRVKVTIRDQWDSPSAPIHQPLADIKDIIGYPVVISPEWGLLWAELEVSYPDPSTFAPSIINVITSWANALKTLADDEANEEWVDALLELIKGRQSLKAIIGVNGSERPSTSWSKDYNAFRIDIPKKTSGRFSHDLTSGFITDFTATVFGKEPKQLPSAKQHIAEAALDDGWDAVEPVAPSTSSHNQAREAAPIAQAPPKPAPLKELPMLNTLPRPEDLLLRPPYHLVMHARSSQHIEIQCSHEASLRLLHDYLVKWCKRNEQRAIKPPAAEIKLCESPFALGLRYDRLTIEIDHHAYGLSAPVFLHLIEAVLGYKMVYGDSTNWTFRKGEVEG